MIRILSIILALLFIHSNSFAYELAALESETAEELLLFFEEEELIIATRRATSVRKAPATATVITAKEIRNMGARNLIDVLERIPGFGITRTNYSVYEIEIRGLKATRNSKIRLMVDGHTLYFPSTGDAAWGFESISLDNVKRVEVIRGPGSALYGANAFTGVINVVTKSGSDLDGTVLTAGAGSFGTEKAGLMHGKEYGDINLLTSITYEHTDGADEIVESDATGKSGRADDWAKNLDASLKIIWNDFTFNTKYLTRRNGPYTGVADTLNDESLLETDQYFADLTFARQLNDQWTVNARGYFDYTRLEFNWELFPEGHAFAPFPAFTFSDGVLGTPAAKGKIFGFELGADYRVLENNTLTIGAVYEKMRQYDVTHHANFHPVTFMNLGSLQDISSWGNWNQDVKRQIMAFYMQDEWEIIDDLTLTAGVRFDDYSDFGNTTSPRIGLVWNISESAEAKLLYGESFRAPNFDEQYSINNPAAIGDPSIGPENMKTYEIMMGYHPIQRATIHVTAFHNKFTDRIELDQSLAIPQFHNSGEAAIHGIESEIQYLIDKYRFYANHTWQRPKDKTRGTRIANIPSNRFNCGLDWATDRYLSGNVHLLHVGKRPRAVVDTRNDLGEYTTLNTTVIIKDFFKALEIRGSAYNIFDEKYAYPAPAGTLSKDYPANGASFFVEARYTF